MRTIEKIEKRITELEELYDDMTDDIPGEKLLEAHNIDPLDDYYYNSQLIHSILQELRTLLI